MKSLQDIDAQRKLLQTLNMLGVIKSKQYADCLMELIHDMLKIKPNTYIKRV